MPLPPGLNGYFQTRNQLNQQDAQQLQSIQGLMALQGQMEDRQMKQQMMPLQMQEHQMKLAKMKQEQEMMAALGPLMAGGQINPEQLDALGTRLALGGHPGAATVMNIADKRRALMQNQQAVQGMQSRPAVNPLTPNDDEGNAMPSTPAQPGLMDPLIRSPYVGPSAQALQNQINQGAPGMNPQQIQGHMDRLLQMHMGAQNQAATQAAIDARQQKGFDNKLELKVQFPPQPKAGAAQGPAMPTDALDMAAGRYLQDGTLPPNLGRGAQGSNNTLSILSRAAAMAKEKGMDGEALRINQVANKSIQSALTGLERQRATVMTYEKTALGGADIALEMSAKVDRTGVPVLNKWINAGRKNVMGDPDVTRLNNAVETFTNEYAKVMSGSSGGQATTVSMQQHAREMLDGKMAPEQFKGAVELMKREMTQTREKAFDAQINEMRDRMKTGSTSAASSPEKTVVRRGTYQGKKVIQYSDGTMGFE